VSDVGAEERIFRMMENVIGITERERFGRCERKRDSTDIAW